MKQALFLFLVTVTLSEFVTSGESQSVIPILHAEFCVPGTINHLTIDTMLVSWTNFVENGGKTSTDIASLVHRTLQVYDWSELRSTSGIKKAK